MPRDQVVIGIKSPVFRLIRTHTSELGRHFLLVAWELLVEESGSALRLKTAPIAFVAGAG